MSDKEIALELTKLGDKAFHIYFDNLEKIRNIKQKNLIGQLEELFYDYDHLSSYCEYNKNKFINDIRELLNRVGDE